MRALIAAFGLVALSACAAVLGLEEGTPEDDATGGSAAEGGAPSTTVGVSTGGDPSTGGQGGSGGSGGAGVGGGVGGAPPVSACSCGVNLMRVACFDPQAAMTNNGMVTSWSSQEAGHPLVAIEAANPPARVTEPNATFIRFGTASEDNTRGVQHSGSNNFGNALEGEEFTVILALRTHVHPASGVAEILRLGEGDGFNYAYLRALPQDRYQFTLVGTEGILHGIPFQSYAAGTPMVLTMTRREETAPNVAHRMWINHQAPTELLTHDMSGLSLSWMSAYLGIGPETSATNAWAGDLYAALVYRGALDSVQRAAAVDCLSMVF